MQPIQKYFYFPCPNYHILSQYSKPQNRRMHYEEIGKRRRRHRHALYWDWPNLSCWEQWHAFSLKVRVEDLHLRKITVTTCSKEKQIQKSNSEEYTCMDAYREKATNTSIANFDDEVGDLETVANGSSSSGHVTRKPVDSSTSLVEPHFSQSLLHHASHSSHVSQTLRNPNGLVRTLVLVWKKKP